MCALAMHIQPELKYQHGWNYSNWAFDEEWCCNPVGLLWFHTSLISKEHIIKTFLLAVADTTFH